MIVSSLIEAENNHRRKTGREEVETDEQRNELEPNSKKEKKDPENKEEIAPNGEENGKKEEIDNSPAYLGFTRYISRLEMSILIEAFYFFESCFYPYSLEPSYQTLPN